jgi:hypothetical protein
VDGRIEPALGRRRGCQREIDHLGERTADRRPAAGRGVDERELAVPAEPRATPILDVEAIHDRGHRVVEARRVRPDHRHVGAHRPERLRAAHRHDPPVVVVGGAGAGAGAAAAAATVPPPDTEPEPDDVHVDVGALTGSTITTRRTMCRSIT